MILSHIWVPKINSFEKKKSWTHFVAPNRAPEVIFWSKAASKLLVLLKIVTTLVQISILIKNQSEHAPDHRLDGLNRTGRSPCTRTTLQANRSTSHRKAKLRRSGVFPEIQVCVSECFWGPRSVFIFMKNRDFSPRTDPKKSCMRQTLWVHRTRLICYEKLW